MTDKKTHSKIKGANAKKSKKLTKEEKELVVLASNIIVGKVLRGMGK